MACENCMTDKNLVLDRIDQEFVQEDGRIFVVEDILVEKCTGCGHIQFTPEAKEYVRKELECFANDGLYYRVRDIAQERSMTYEEIGEALGVQKKKKQYAYQLLNRSGMRLINAFKLSRVFGEPIETLFEYRPIYEKDGKYYLSKG